MRRLCIVEDKSYFREMLVDALAADGHFAVVGQATDGQAAIALCLKLSPDVCLLDAMLPELSGYEFLRTISSQLPDMRVLVFTGHAHPQLVCEMLEAGARGIVEKTEGIPELVKALKVITRGDLYLSAAIIALLPAASAFRTASAISADSFDQLLAQFRGR